MASSPGRHAPPVPGHRSGGSPGEPMVFKKGRRELTENTCQAKKDLVTVKQQRLSLAQDEWNHLNSTLSHLSNSTTSCKWQLPSTYSLLSLTFSSCLSPQTCTLQMARDTPILPMLGLTSLEASEEDPKSGEIHQMPSNSTHHFQTQPTAVSFPPLSILFLMHATISISNLTAQNTILAPCIGLS